MKLGLNLGYLGPATATEEHAALARAAEELGFDSVWAAEAYGSDAATVLSWIAARTERINVGSAVFQMPGRSPAMTAMTAATLDQLSGGRMLLGLGTSGPQVAEGWHGQRFARPLRRTREYVEIVRRALARERVEYDGDFYGIPLPGGEGKPLKLTIQPAQSRLPILLAALGPNNVRLAGEIADGWLPLLLAPEHVGDSIALLREGAARAGREPDDFFVCPTVNVAIDEDLAAARSRVRPLLALYVGGMGSRKQNFYNRLVGSYGFADTACEVQDLYLAGRTDEAARAVPDDLIDLVALCGPRERVTRRLRDFERAGVHTLIAAPVASTHETRLDQLNRLAHAAREI